jgi:hypothetical protein
VVSNALNSAFCRRIVIVMQESSPRVHSPAKRRGRTIFRSIYPAQDIHCLYAIFLLQNFGHLNVVSFRLPLPDVGSIGTPAVLSFSAPLVLEALVFAPFLPNRESVNCSFSSSTGPIPSNSPPTRVGKSPYRSTNYCY